MGNRRSTLTIAGMILVGAAAMFFAGCKTEHPHHERLVSPVQQDMSGRKGYDMPKTRGAPMPSGWKGFRAY